MKLRSALDVVVKDIESEYGQNWHKITNPYIDRPVL